METTRPAKDRLADMPEPGHVVMEHIPGVVTTIRATLLPGMSLTLPPVPAEMPVTADHVKQFIDLLTRIDERLVGLRSDGDRLAKEIFADVMRHLDRAKYRRGGEWRE